MFIWKAKFSLSCLFGEQFGHNSRFQIVDLPTKGFTVQTSTYNCILVGSLNQVSKKCSTNLYLKTENLHFKIPVNTSKHLN